MSTNDAFNSSPSVPPNIPVTPGTGSRVDGSFSTPSFGSNSDNNRVTPRTNSALGIATSRLRAGFSVPLITDAFTPSRPVLVRHQNNNRQITTTDVGEHEVDGSLRPRQRLPPQPPRPLGQQQQQPQPQEQQQQQQQQHQENDSLLPLEKDVLCGRGGRKNINHPGNKNYRAVIQTNKPVFDQCRLRTEKRDLSIAIVASIRAGGGRFLQPRKAEDTNKVAAGTTTWCEIGDPKAVEKTLQALREKRHDTDRQHEQQTTTNDDEEEKDDAGTTTTSTTTTSDDDADVVDFVLPPIPTSSISLFQDWITRRKTLWRLKWNHLAETKKKGKKRDPLINDDSIIAVTGDTIIWTDKFSEDFPQIFKKLNTPLKLINKKYFYPNRGCRVDHAYGMKILHDFGLLEEYWTEFHKLYSKVPIPCPEDISGEITILKCKKDGRRQSVSKKDGYPAPRVVLRKKIMLSKENEIIFDFRCHVCVSFISQKPKRQEQK